MSLIPVSWEAKEDLDVKAGMDNLTIEPKTKMLKVYVLIVKQGTKPMPLICLSMYMFSIAENSVKGTYCHLCYPRK